MEPGPLVRRGDGFAASASIVTPSPDRVAPPCPHFGTCGGCSLQHWDAAPYLEWKRGLLVGALRRAGYAEAAVGPVVVCAPGARRRMDLAVRRQGPALLLGLHPAHSTEIVDLDTCPVLHPRLMGLIAPLRQMLRRLNALKREGSAIVNLLDSGPDVLLRLDAQPDATDRARLASFGVEHNLPRLSVAIGKGPTEPGAQLKPPTTSLSGVSITPPPGAFLQATESGEAAIIAAVLAGLPTKVTSKSRIAELFAGCGTLSFAIARQIRVASFEGDAAAVGALSAGANNAGLAGRIEAVRRDLGRQPLMPKELAAFAGVVLDPPFDGAATQTAQIAASGVKRVVYVSCNPAALARDAKMLHAAGFKLLAATAIDQFLWSARLESVSVFGK